MGSSSDAWRWNQSEFKAKMRQGRRPNQWNGCQYFVDYPSGSKGKYVFMVFRGNQRLNQNFEIGGSKYEIIGQYFDGFETVLSAWVS